MGAEEEPEAVDFGPALNTAHAEGSPTSVRSACPLFFIHSSGLSNNFRLMCRMYYTDV